MDNNNNTTNVDPNAVESQSSLQQLQNQMLTLSQSLSQIQVPDQTLSRVLEPSEISVSESLLWSDSQSELSSHDSWTHPNLCPVIADWSNNLRMCQTIINAMLLVGDIQQDDVLKVRKMIFDLLEVMEQHINSS
ncbi:hypothetical protein KR044_004910 [Drosophila immigrans]|nr:hypothetical protein KR044_004910 [Drosophila immigrans]